ncbi:DnaJ domain-containing protein [bacterium]|nr:DnaJ domain-containing protein [candidate division CSSED10-310 bacterium]
MSQKGDLTNIPFEKLLVWLSRQNKTGTLRITQYNRSKYVLFEKSQIISAYSEFPEDNYKAVIRRMQLLPATQQAELELESGTSDVDFARTVIEKGYVTEREFLDVLKRQNQDIILSLFEWRKGDFVFFEDQLPEKQPIALKMPLAGIVERGVERARKRRQLMSRLPENAIFRVIDAEFRKRICESSTIPVNVRLVFDCLQEPLTLRDIVSETGLTEYEAIVILAQYVEENRIEAIQADKQEVSEDIRKILAEAEILFTRKRYWEAWSRIRKAVRELPGNPELQALYRQYSRDFKADLHATIVSTDRIPVAVKTVDEELFARFPKDTALGFILSRIDGTSSIKSLSQMLNIPTDKLMLTLYLLIKSGIVKLVQPRGPIPEEIARRRQAVRKIWERISGRSFYEVLSINRDASPADIKSVYFEMAKQFHPDRRPDDDPEDVKEKLDQIFVQIREAYQTLSDPERREAYDQRMGDQSMDIDVQKSRSKAHLQYRVGLKAFQTRKYRTAMEYFRSAIDLDPYEPEYYFKMAELCTRNPKWYRAGTLACLKAIQLDPEVPEFHAVLGVLHRLQGDLVTAEKEFFQTLQFDPENKTARRELQSLGKALPDLDAKSDTQYTPIPRKDRTEERDRD